MAEDGQLCVPTTMPGTDLSPTKRTMRDTAREKRASLSPVEIAGISDRICKNLLGILDGMDPLIVYVSKPREVDTHRLIEQLISGNRKVVVPVIEKETKTLRLSWLYHTSDLVESTFGVPEPIGSEHPADPRNVVAVIVPMLGFDQQGHRLGYGAGYYDRFLSAYPHLLKIGLAFSCLETAEVPVDAHDISMDLIITERGVIRCGNRRVPEK